MPIWFISWHKLYLFSVRRIEANFSCWKLDIAILITRRTLLTYTNCFETFQIRHFLALCTNTKKNSWISLFYVLSSQSAVTLILKKLSPQKNLSFRRTLPKQVPLVATTRLILDWIRFKHHLLLLAEFYFENYRWTYIQIRKNCILFSVMIILLSALPEAYLRWTFQING